MNDLELYIYIALVLVYFLTRALKPKKGKKAPKSPVESPSMNQETSRTQRKERPMTFEELLEEFTGYKEPPQPAPSSEEIIDVEEEQKEIQATDEEIQYYEEYDDYKTGEYANYDEVFEKSVKLTTLDEQVSLEEPVQKEWKVYEKQSVSYTRAKRFREMLTAKDSIKDAIILKELLDPKYLEF